MLVELVINGYVLIINRKSIPTIWLRVAPVLIGPVVCVAIGSYILSLVHPASVKFVTYNMLLPLILRQASDIRKHIQDERAIAIPFGIGIGTLYSVTTISGHPLTELFNNQGYTNRISVPRWASFEWQKGYSRESPTIFIGLYRYESMAIIPYIIPGALLGIPLGSYLIRLMDPETFRRICMPSTP